MAPKKQVTRLTFGAFIDRAFWAVIVGITGYVATQARDINANISSLNEKMAAIMSKVADQENRMDRYDTRLLRVEDWIVAQKDPSGP